MKQIRLLKNWRSKKIGDIINISKKGAEQFIQVGAGEYVNTQKEKRKLVKIKFIKEHTEENNKGNFIVKNKIGDVVDASEENAKKFVELDYAEYVSVKKEKNLNNKMNKNKDFAEFKKNNEEKGVGISKEDYEKAMSQGKKADMERLLEYKLIKFAETKRRKGIIQIKDEFIEVENSKIPKEENPAFIFEREGQVLEFMKHQPIFYDETGMFWFWDNKNKYWKYSKDDVNILNLIRKNINVNTINSKDKTEITNALRQVGREKMPEELNKKCIQFLNKIYNLETDEFTDPNPKYFATNPIPWKIGDSEETPTIDKYFREWVGDEYTQTLYEIIAYSSCSEQFLQRMIALVGGGSNGKGTFIKLLKKFLGKDNCASSELSLLSSNQFETSMIYKKLLCEMGEVSYDDLKNTNQIKKLSGEDDIRYCFKGKTAFSDKSPTTCIINTNSLPNTPDKTIGFYRKWLIIDFPNQFPIKSGLIEKIPDKEFENLAKKSIRILKELYKRGGFTNEGDFDERAKRYEQRSNPTMKFIEEYCEEDFGKYCSFKKFCRKLNDFLFNNHLRILSPKSIKKNLISEGFEIRRGTKDYVTDTYIFNLEIKNIPNIPNIPKSQIHSSRVNLISKNGINGIKCIKTQNNDENQTNSLKLSKKTEKTDEVSEINFEDSDILEDLKDE